ncbi:MAG: tRNA lysidine(34) synthetase TilS [Phycisphaerales bacterium]|nr:tRNA lysidine(34) synthetase TilS [Phycisphaerales bacterium]
MCDVPQPIYEDGFQGTISKNHPFSARILRRWRALTGGKSVRDEDRRTLIACSGGADSIALAAVLASVRPRPIIGHVLHDIRNDGSAELDRDVAKKLADIMGCSFLELNVKVKEQSGNLENNARSARYQALCKMADESGLNFIVSGHHADDQLETVLMRLIRGTSVRGLGGVHPSRPIGNQTLIRPMLDTTREEIESFCVEHSLQWREDATNKDIGYLRNRLRHEVIPVLQSIEPHIASKAAKLSASSQSISIAFTKLVEDLFDLHNKTIESEWCWNRKSLRTQPDAVLVELVFYFARRVLESKGIDTINQRSIDMFVQGVKSDVTEPRSYRVGPMVILVRANSVQMINPSSHGNQEL